MSCNHLSDCPRCGGIADDLEERALSAEETVKNICDEVEAVQKVMDKYKNALNELRCSVVAALILLPQGNDGKMLLENAVKKANGLLNHEQDNAEITGG